MLASALIWIGVGVAALFVGWPLFQARLGGREPAAPDSLPPLERQKREALAAIKEAEFDRAMGKLSDDDFAQLTARYREQALIAMAALESAQATKTRPGGSAAYCPQCGGKLAPAANFCGGCGHALRPQAA
jgi:hypothetical protein